MTYLPSGRSYFLNVLLPQPTTPGAKLLAHEPLGETQLYPKLLVSLARVLQWNYIPSLPHTVFLLFFSFGGGGIFFETGSL